MPTPPNKRRRGRVAGPPQIRSPRADPIPVVSPNGTANRQSQRPVSVPVVFELIFLYNQSKLSKAYADRFWYYVKNGCLVVSTTGDPYCAQFVYCIRNVGSLSGRSLYGGALPFPILLTGSFRGLAARMVWTEAILVAIGTTVLTRHPHSLGARRIQTHLLLLSRRLL
jgi:hypothetical protein